MALSTDLKIWGQYRPNASGSVSAVSSGGQFSQVFSAAYQTSGGTNYERYFQTAADTYQIPVGLLRAMAQVESNFNANAVSSCGAQGIMQLMPATARSLGVTNSFDPAQNIMGGAKYLRQMLDRFDGDISKAVAAYNAGPNAVKKYGGVPPYQETQNYVSKVLGYAGNNVSVSAPAASTISVMPSYTTEDYASNAPLTQDELTELFYQIYRSSGIYSQESIRMIFQQLLLQKEQEKQDQKNPVSI